MIHPDLNVARQIHIATVLQDIVWYGLRSMGINVLGTSW